MMKDIMMNQLGTRTQALLSIIVGWIAVVAVSVSPLSAEQIRNETESQPWWDQEKIRFFWGCWYHLPNAGVPMEEVMKNLSQIGATVFVERHWLNLDHARLARKYGIRYFGVLSAGPGGIAVQQTSWLPARFKKELDVRWWVNEKGITHMGKDPKYPCPLCKPVYEAWFLAPVLEAAESGLVDGMHMDWEAYADWVELPGKKPGPCYCDDCFGQFLSRKTQRADLPKSERYKWLEAQGQVKEYREVFDQRREQMYRGFAQRIRQVKPQFVFSMYHGRVTPLSRGLHTDDVPVLIVDPSHYYDHHTRPWWEIPRSYHRKHGMRHIGGSWDNSLFGGQPESGISASQWMYEVAVNMDGYWMWFEQELTPSDWRAFWIANRRIGATEAKVGKFLLAGKQDLHFVTPVEWSGNPAFERRIILRTYHLEDEHLVHVNNVDLDLPIQVRLRFPRLSENTRWTVRDPMSDLAYVHDGDRRLWSAQQLARGMTISLEKRSELFLRLSPEGRDRGQKTAGVITSQEISPMPDHPEGERQDPEDRTPTGRERLAYLKTESLGFLGNHCREIGQRHSRHGCRRQEPPAAAAAQGIPLVTGLVSRRHPHRFLSLCQRTRADLRDERRRDRGPQSQPEQLLRQVTGLVSGRSDDRLRVGPGRGLGDLRDGPGGRATETADRECRRGPGARLVSGWPLARVRERARGGSGHIRDERRRNRLPTGHKTAGSRPEAHVVA